MSEEKVEKRAVMLQPERMQHAEYWRQDWVVNAEVGTTVQDVLDPQYWCHMASQIKPYDRVEVRLETGEWILELVVLSVDRTWAKVHVLHHHDLSQVTDEAPGPAKTKVQWRGAHHKHSVVRLSDNTVLETGFANKEDAAAWARQYEQRVLTT